MKFEEALKLLGRGRSILFTGSGFSFGATNKRKMPDGSFAKFRGAKDIAKAMADMVDDLKDEKDLELGAVAQYCKEKLPIGTLLDFLKDEFEVTKISEEHGKIGLIPWRRCYTTNYDEIIEIARRRAGHRCETATMSTPIKDIDINGACVHINGSITRLTKETLDGEFKLTNQSYLDEGLKFTEWFNTFREDLLSADVVIFIGFSGDYDLDLTRTFQQTKELREKTFFIVAKGISILKRRKLEAFGEVLDIGLDGFIQKCEEVGYLNHTVYSTDIHDDAIPIRCFRSPVVDTKRRNVKATEFYDLITRGEIDPCLLEWSVREPKLTPYYIFRDRIDEITQNIEDGNNRILILSNLGNGKTLLIEGLAIILKKKGYSPYIFDKEREFITDETRQICENNLNPVLIFDNYTSNWQLIKKLTRQIDIEVPIILTERTGRYETGLNKLLEIDENFKINNIDALSRSEILHIVDLFDKYGLWDERAAYSTEGKADYIIKNCHSKLSLFLLSRLDAKQIKSSYSNVINAIRTKKEYYEVLLFILFMKYFDFKIEYGRLLEILGTHIMNNAGFMCNPDVNEVIDFEKETIKFNSGLLAQHILTTYIDKEEIADYLIRLFTNLDYKVAGDKKLKGIMRGLMQYRNLKQILQNKQIYRIYEDISNCRFCREHPLFWLQYAIAKTADSQFEIAEHYFNTAYSHAIPTDFNTFQIDNHFAHFLLKRALESPELDTRFPIDIFREVHRKLSKRQRGDELKHYIYKVAADYKPFIDKHYSEFSVAQRSEIINSCREIIKMADEFLSRAGASEVEMVRETVKSLQSIPGV